jgi:hypothetical protein
VPHSEFTTAAEYQFICVLSVPPESVKGYFGSNCYLPNVHRTTGSVTFRRAMILVRASVYLPWPPEGANVYVRFREVSHLP